MISKPIFGGPELMTYAPNQLDEGVGWSDEKNISDLGQKLVISLRSVFLVQSHQISRAELENPSGRTDTLRPPLWKVCVGAL